MQEAAHAKQSHLRYVGDCRAAGRAYAGGGAHHTNSAWAEEEPSVPPPVLVAALSGHLDVVLSVAFSPDGRKALTGSGDKTAKLWDVSTGRELRTFQASLLRRLWGKLANMATSGEGITVPVLRGSVHSVAFSPDGRKVLTGTWDTTAKLWDVATGRELRTFKGHTGWIFAVAFSPDGQQVLSGSEDGTAKLWDVATGQELRSFQGHRLSITSVAFSPDGRRVLTGADDETAKLWDVATGRELRTFQGHTRSVTSVAFSPDGGKVLTGSGDGSARLWELGTGRELVQLWHLKGGGWIAIVPEGYFEYDGSNETLERVNLQDSSTGRPLTPEEAKRYHRPDLVTKVLSGGP